MSQKVRQLQKVFQRSYTVISTDLFNAIKNCRRKFRFINTLSTLDVNNNATFLQAIKRITTMSENANLM